MKENQKNKTHPVQLMQDLDGAVTAVLIGIAGLVLIIAAQCH